MPRALIYNGHLYVEAVHHPLESTQQQSLRGYYEVVQAHSKECLEDSQIVTSEVAKLSSVLRELAAEVVQCLQEDGKIKPEKITLLDPKQRVKQVHDPIRSLEKANRNLNYVVDALISTTKGMLSQLDTMVDSWSAEMESISAPNVSRESTEPLMMIDVGEL